MNTRGARLTGGLAAVALATTLSAPVHIGDTRFTLARAVPNDVFVFAAEQHNPEREFLCQYWGDVFDALRQCGIDEDIVELIGSLLGAEHKAEVDDTVWMNPPAASLALSTCRPSAARSCPEPWHTEGRQNGMSRPSSRILSSRQVHNRAASRCSRPIGKWTSTNRWPSSTR